jgi:hypothetical protein
MRKTGGSSLAALHKKNIDSSLCMFSKRILREIKKNWRILLGRFAQEEH